MTHFVHLIWLLIYCQFQNILWTFELLVDQNESLEFEGALEIIRAKHSLSSKRDRDVRELTETHMVIKCLSLDFKADLMTPKTPISFHDKTFTWSLIQPQLRHMTTSFPPKKEVKPSQWLLLM